MDDVIIGVDIGQKRDPTALCVVELEVRKVDGRDDVHYVVRHLDRLPLGTPYPKVASRLGEVVAGVAEQTEQTPRVYVDATGVGAPVVDLLKEQALDAWVTPVFFTHGDRRTEEGGEIRLGKAWLVSKLQTLLQSRRLHLPRTAEAEVLAQELLDYEIRVDERANDRYGAFRVGTHDDLVTAVGLSVQQPWYGTWWAV